MTQENDMKTEIVREFIPSNVKLFIATPCYSYMYHAEYLAGLIRTYSELTAKGVTIHWHTVNNQIIDKARDYLAWYFLAKTDCTHMIMIDDDMGWSPDDVVQLLASDKQVVAAAGRRKTDKSEMFCVNLNNPASMSEPDFHQCQETGLLRVYSVGAAFLMIKREVIERMSQGGLDRLYTEEFSGERITLPNLFPSERFLGAKWSEDFGFCRLWGQFGGEIWLDPTIQLSHIGRKNYTGDPMKFIKEKYDEHKRAREDAGAGSGSTAADDTAVPGTADATSQEG